MPSAVRESDQAEGQLSLAKCRGELNSPTPYAERGRGLASTPLRLTAVLNYVRNFLKIKFLERKKTK